MDAVNARVQKVIDKVALNRTEFSEKTGISTVVISHICSGRNKVSLAAIQQILKAYSDISAEYLVNGHGSMFKNEDQRMDDLVQGLKDIQSSIKVFRDDAEQKISKILRNIENS